MKDGLSLEFATTMFQTWLTEKGIGHISSALRKAQLEKRLMVSGQVLCAIAVCSSPYPSSLSLPQELLPPTRQLPHHFDEHFSAVGLEPLVKFRQAQQNAVFKQRLREEIDELLGAEAPSDEVVERCQQHMASTSLSDVDVTVLVRGEGVTVGRKSYSIVSTCPSQLQLWRSIMDSVEWNKKEELVAEQALKHLRVRKG